MSLAEHLRVKDAQCPGPPSRNKTVNYGALRREISCRHSAVTEFGRRGDTLGGAARSRLVLTPASAVKPGFPGRPTSPRFVVEAEAVMKWLKWIAIAIVVTVGVLLFLNKDDLRRTMQMRQMLWS
jgi:hypothetical protein